MNTRTTQKQRDALRCFIVERLIVPVTTQVPDGDRWVEVLDVLRDCNDAIDRVESIENRLTNAYDGITSAQGYVASLLSDVGR